MAADTPERRAELAPHPAGLAHHDEEEAQAAERELKRIKGYLWNGNHQDALTCIDGLANDLDDLEDIPTTYPGIKAFRKGVDEFHTYVRRNAHTIANYAERHRYTSGSRRPSRSPPSMRLSESASRNASRCAGQSVRT